MSIKAKNNLPALLCGSRTSLAAALAARRAGFGVKTMSVKIGSFKGHRTISLDAYNKYPFTFGEAKAKLIVQHFEDIKRFVGSQPASNGDRFDMQTEDNMRDACGA